MRILNVSFSNLNSLAGDWFVDFEDPEYQLNGLFLITGPTGSGKTTLLDAITLGLYGQTPRLSTISASQNEIMTRGTNSCRSEVTFETGEGRFHSCWSQKRKKNGALDSPVRSLWREPGEIIAGKSREVDQEIIRLTGLDYSQFTRAIMLAQGAFSAFLRAKDDEKSAILEKITDTSIYSGLSRLAYKKAAEETRRKEKLEQDLAEIKPLDAAAEQAKLEQMKKISQELDATRNELDVCNKQLKWLETIAKLERDAEALAANQAALNLEIAAFEPKRGELANAKKAAFLEPEFALLAELRASRVRLRDNLEKNVLQKVELDRIAEDAERRVKQLEAQYGAAEQTLELARPELEAARSLDRKISDKKMDLNSRQAQKDMAESHVKTDRAKLAARKKDREDTARTIADLDSWFEQNAQDEWLEANLGALKGKLQYSASQWRLVARAEEKETGTEKEISKSDAQIKEAQEELKRIRLQKQGCAELLSDLESRRTALLAGWTLEGLRDAQRQKQELKTAAAAIRSLEEHRKALADGQPCPLCGALEHPYASGQLPDVDIITTQIHELDKQINSINEIVREIAGREKEQVNATLEEEKVRERINGMEGQKRILAERLATEQQQAADLKREALGVDVEIRSQVEPLGICAETGNSGISVLLDKRLAEWNRRKDLRKAAQEKHAQIEIGLAAQEADLAARERDASEKAKELEDCAREMTAMTAARAEILGGRPAGAEEARLKQVKDMAQMQLKKAGSDFDKATKELANIAGQTAGLTRQLEELEPKLAQKETDFAAALAQNGWNEPEYLAARREAAAIVELERIETGLRDRQTRLAASMSDKKRELEAELALELTDKAAYALEADKGELEARQRSAFELEAQIRQELRQNGEKREKAAELSEQLELQRAETRKWSRLNDLVGSADGKKFRAFAQNITLDLLLAHANRQLAKITDRYTLQRYEDRNPANSREKFLDIAIVDNYQAGETRAIDNLSGGETFIASLALSLGLSAMAGKQSSLGSLFLDEGFGTLDADTLEIAIDAIESLGNEGKLIGIISHVDTLKRIHTQIQIKPKALLGRSMIEGPGCRPGR